MKVGAPVGPAPQFPVLDTLRLVGALCVVTTHVAFEATAYGRYGVWGAVLSRLDVGVAIFFVLSGFLLFRPHLAAATLGRPGPGAGRYYWKRFLRIFPVYAVTAALALALIPENDGSGPIDWLRTLLLLDTFTEPRLPQGLTQMWSLAVEACYYLVLPLLAALTLGRPGRTSIRPRRIAAVLVGLATVAVLWQLLVGGNSQDDLPGVPLTWLPGYLTWFAVGMLLAYVHVRLSVGDDSRLVHAVTALGSMPGVCWAAVGGLLLVAATPLGGPIQLYVATPAQSVTKGLLYASIGGLVVVTGAFGNPSSRYAAAMSQPLLRHLGHVSYSVFCLHMPVLYFVMEWGDFPLFGGHTLQIWLITVAVSLVLAELSYRLVELPAQRLRRLRPPWVSADESQPSSSAQPTTTST